MSEQPITLKKIFPVQKQSGHSRAGCRCAVDHTHKEMATYSSIPLNCNSLHNGLLQWKTEADQDMDDDQGSRSQTDRNSQKQYCLRDKKQRHVYHTIEISNSISKIDGEQVKKAKPPVPYKPHYLQAKYSTKPSPLVPPRIKNTEAAIQRRQLTEEYFENIIRNVDEEQERSSTDSRKNQTIIQHSLMMNGSFDHASADYTQSSHQNLTSSLKLLKLCGWYWGDMTWKEAELMLEQRPGEIGKNFT